MNTLSQPIQAKTSSGGILRILAVPTDNTADAMVLVGYSDGRVGFEELRFLRVSALPVWEVERELQQTPQ